MSADYHSHPAISRSMLMDFLTPIKGRRIYQATHIDKTMPPVREVNALRIGSVSHVSVLQPSRFNELVGIIPNDLLASNGALSTTAAKDWKKAEEAKGKTVVKESEVSDILGMREALQKDEQVNWIFSPRAICEQPIFWTDPETGLELRAMPDFILPLQDTLICADLKTCADISKFEKQMSEHYFLQPPQYISGLHAEYGEELEIIFTFIAVEKTAPYAVNEFQMEPEMMDQAYQIWRRTLNELSDCYKANTWRDPSQDRVIRVNRQIYAKGSV